MFELELAKIVVSYYTENNFSVYKEVTDGNKRADIVSVKEGITTVIEVKKRLGFNVIQQALYWSNRANYIYIAVPKFKRSYYLNTICSILGYLKYKNIGLILIDKDKLNFQYNPILNKNIKNGIDKFLLEGQKDFIEAGTSSKYWTRFKDTELKIKEFLLEHPQSTIREIVTGIEHHYSSKNSAISSIKKAIDKGWINGVIKTEFMGNNYYKME